MAKKIAILEDSPDRQAIMRACLADRFYMFDAQFFDESAEMIEFLDRNLDDTVVIALDHDLELKPGPDGRCVDPGTGRDVADYLAARAPVCPVVIHTTNANAAVAMDESLRAAGWKIRRVIPFDDMNWIASDWFPKIRRAIVGPVRKPLPARNTPS